MIPVDAGSFLRGRWVPVEAPDGVLTRAAPADLDDALPPYAFALGHVDEAVAAARAAQPAWSALGLDARMAFLTRLRDAIAQHENALALAISREMGKVIREARAEVKAMIAKVDITLGEGLALVRDTTLDARFSWRWRPHGVLAVLGPFNFPLHLPHGHIVPALLLGNAVVFKPSEVTPGCAAVYAQVVESVGLPPGVFNLVQGDGVVGAALGAHEGVDGVLFTGSYGVGEKLRRVNVSTPGRLLALELGGKNAAVVLDDAPFDKAVEDVVVSAFSTTGQRCSCASRLVVTRGIAERFVAEVARRAAALAVGHPLDPAAFCGPLATPRAVEKFEALQRLAEEEGAHAVILPGEAAVTWEGRAHRGCYVTPRVRVVARREKRSAYQREEAFGPDLAVYIVDDLDEALSVADDTDYGLTAGVWTASEAAFEQAARTLRVGGLSWNSPTVGASSRLPFGGVKNSGNHRPAGSFSTLYCAYPMAITRA
ncbi:MAG: astD [Myxococcaceae bacterium]|nr:astD [Myxococcaceae bacterium]